MDLKIIVFTLVKFRQKKWYQENKIPITGRCNNGSLWAFSKIKFARFPTCVFHFEYVGHQRQNFDAISETTENNKPLKIANTKDFM